MALLGAVSCCKKTQPGEPALYSAADFDSTIDGKAVSLYTLKNANGMAAQITNYGGIIVDVWVPAKDGAFKDVVLGYPKLADYFVPENTFAGAITGRYANRIANGKFTLDGKEYSLAINNGRTPSSKIDYKEVFFKEHPELRGEVWVHHGVEQQVLTKPQTKGLFSYEEMHSLDNLRGIPKEINSDLHLSKIRKEWNKFYKEFPNPTKEQLLQKRLDIDKKYGHLFKPPIDVE